MYGRTQLFGALTDFVGHSRRFLRRSAGLAQALRRLAIHHQWKNLVCRAPLPKCREISRTYLAPQKRPQTPSKLFLDNTLQPVHLTGPPNEQ